MTPLFRSATVKLTLSYLLIVMAISLGFSAAIFKVGHDELVESLHNQRAHIYLTYPVFTNDPFFQHDVDATIGSKQLLTNLAYLNALVLVGAGFVSYWLARRTLRPIEAANLLQKHFVADASHELRTPLTALKMESEVALLDKSAPRSELRRALASNLEEANKLDSLLDNLLQLSRLEETSDLHLIDAHLASITDEALGQITAAAKAKHISVKSDVPDNLYVYGDPASLVQLLVILLDNAIKYSHDDARVALDANQQGNETLVRITDHGVGIKPDELERVFDRFYRADTSRQTDGYGLGLSIAKRLADLNRGTLVLTSTEGKGTTATVRLPATGPDSVASPNDTV